VGNLVSAIETCVKYPAASNRTFFVSDDEDVSMPQLVTSIAAALGRRPRLFAFPPGLLQRLGRLLRREHQVARLTESLQVDISRIKNETGWKPPFSLQQGLMQTVSWYRAQSR
jgi:UDP-glucose 4-epimerase